MKTYRTTLFVLSSFLVQPDNTLSDTGELNQTDQLSGGGMLAMIVLGIFGVALLAVICCASWSMIMTCFELHASKTVYGGESFEEPEHNIIRQGKYYFTSNVFHHPLASEGAVNSTESVV